MFGLGVGDDLELGSYSPEQTELGARGRRGRRTRGARRPVPDRRASCAGPSTSASAARPAASSSRRRRSTERYRDEIGGYVDALIRVRAPRRRGRRPRGRPRRASIFGDDLFIVIGVSDETQGVSDAIDVLADRALGLRRHRRAGRCHDHRRSCSSANSVRRTRDQADPGRDGAHLATTRARGRRGRGAAPRWAARCLPWPSPRSSRPCSPSASRAKAEADPGFQLDAPVLGLGVVAILGFTLLVSGVRRMESRARLRARARRAESDPTVGHRPGGGERGGEPVAHDRHAHGARTRSAGRPRCRCGRRCIGATLGTLGMTAVLVFGASLDHLAATPRLYGWGWDTTVEPERAVPRRAPRARAATSTRDRR